MRFPDSTSLAAVFTLAFGVACGATHRIDDAPQPLDVDASTGGSGGEANEIEDDSEPLIVGEPEAAPSNGGPTAEGTGGAPPLPVPEPETSVSVDAGVIPVPSLPLVDVPLPSFEGVPLPTDTSYPTVGVLVDDRAAAAPAAAPNIATDCALVQGLSAERQRTTTAMGVQFSVGLTGPAGLPLPASSFADCLALSDLEDVVLPAAKSSAPATGALTLLLLQPGQTPEEQALLQEAALKLFMSRPQGERVALYRWGATVDQVVGFTTFRDMFGDGLKERVPLLEGEAVDVNIALSSAAAALSGVADDSFPWTRSVVVLAPHMLATEIVPVQREVHVLFAVGAEGMDAFNLVHTTAAAPSDAMGQVSARLNAARDAGFVTYGVCGAGAALPVRVRAASGAQLELELKAALPEEMTGAACDPEQVAAFQFIDTNLIELAFTAAEREIYDEVLQERDDSVDFALTAQLAAGLGPTPALAHLRGGTSLMQCPDERVNYSLDLSGGRERFFFADGSGSVGSDEFYLTAMCLDPMYINQLSVARLMAPLGIFVSGVKMVEVRVDGQTQGVYLLMEQVKEAFVRTQAGLRSVIRRRNSGDSEVKFPSDTDVAGQELALADFDDLTASLSGLSGVERLAAMRSRIDIYRYMNFVAFQSIVHNADWGDEPSQYAVNSLGAAGPSSFYSINGWDHDDVLLDECAHDEVIRDPFELIGCAEFSFEKAFFGNGSANSNSVMDDEVYALYADVLENALGYFTEARVGAAFEQTAADLTVFSIDPAIVDIMPDFRNQDDVAAAINAAVMDRKQAFAARRAFLLEQLATYRAR